MSVPGNIVRFILPERSVEDDVMRLSPSIRHNTCSSLLVISFSTILGESWFLVLNDTVMRGSSDVAELWNGT